MGRMAPKYADIFYINWNSCVINSHKLLINNELSIQAQFLLHLRKAIVSLDFNSFRRRT